jgi:hypothetical protein
MSPASGVCCQVMNLRQADHLSRGILPSGGGGVCVCVCVIACDRVQQEQHQQRVGREGD